MSLFLEGQKPTLKEVLAARENRVRFQEKLLNQYPDTTLICFKCNIPGEVKNNKTIQAIFSLGKEEIMDKFESEKTKLLYSKEININTGPEFFLIVQESPEVIKEEMMRIEEDTPIGRLYDMDVLYKQTEVLHSLSRQELGKSERKCLICSKSAKNCGRNRTHSLEEMHQKIKNIIEEDGRLSY